VQQILYATQHEEKKDKNNETHILLFQLDLKLSLSASRTEKSHRFQNKKKSFLNARLTILNLRNSEKYYLTQQLKHLYNASNFRT